MTTPSFIRPDGVRLAYRDVGSGPAVLFQHGLGGDDAQVGDVFPHAAQVRRITLECRGQGRSAFGPQSALSIATFTDDAIALLDHLRVPMPLVGGISMGAAIALRAAVLWPERFRGLVLARPAWVAETAPSNMAPYALVGELMVCHEPNKARRIFRESPIASLLAAQAPDNSPVSSASSRGHGLGRLAPCLRRSRQMVRAYRRTRSPKSPCPPW